MMDDGQPASGGQEFPSTSWTLVSAAQGPGSPAAVAALAELCRVYWYPLFAYIRRKGHAPEDAQDLTQELFARLLEGEALRGVERDKGRFRAYLLACCRNFLANERDRARAAKRGGGRPTVSIDLDDAERRYRNEPADRVSLSPELLFERRWALTLVDRTRDELEREYCSSGKGELFGPLMAGLDGGPGAPTYAEVARALGMNEPAVKKAAQRLRQRFAALLRRHVAATVSAPDEVEDEVRDLMAALGP